MLLYIIITYKYLRSVGKMMLLILVGSMIFVAAFFAFTYRIFNVYNCKLSLIREKLIPLRLSEVLSIKIK